MHGERFADNACNPVSNRSPEDSDGVFISVRYKAKCPDEHSQFLSEWTAI